MNINKEVTEELLAMKSIGMRVTNKVINKAKTEDLTEYNNMSISDIADLMIDLHGN